MKHKKYNKIILAAVIVFAALFCFCAVTYFLTPVFMVHPTFNKDAYSAMEEMIDEGSSGLDRIDIRVSESDVILSGYFLDCPDTDDLIIYLGGINDDAAGNMEQFLSIYPLNTLASGYDIACIDWAGYGLSSGQANEASLVASAAAILDHFSGHEKTEGKVILTAYSMGTGPAVYAASHCGCDGLILISPYAEAKDLYNSVIDIFHGPFEMLQPYKMRSIQYAADVDIRPLIIASEDDSRVPYASSLKLADAFPEGADVVTLHKITHGELMRSEEVTDAIFKYLESVN